MDNNKPLCPFTAAQIAIEALKGGKISKIAKKYAVPVHLVNFYREFLEENAVELFLAYDQERSIFHVLRDMREQVQLLERNIIDAAEIIGIKCCNYFSE